MYKIISHKCIAHRVYKMVLEGDTDKITKPGQFINIRITGKYLRRPISVCDYDDSTITIIYKIYGEGTKILSQYDVGDTLDCLVGLGNGFDTNIKEDKILLVGGGVGVPPLYNLCKELIKKEKSVTVALGFKDEQDKFYEEEFSKLAKTFIFVDNLNGYLTDNIQKFNEAYYFACGPSIMLDKMLELKMNGQLSYESRMGCGFGACMGCSKKTNKQPYYKRVCKEGPVFTSEELMLNDES